MNDWLPVIAGYGGLIVIIAASRVLPRSWLRDELGRRYGVKPKGAYEVMTRRDLVRRALLSAVGAIVLMVSGLVLFPLSERFPNESTPRLALEAYSFIALILSMVALLAGVIALIQVAFWRPRRIRLTQGRLLDFANYLERMRLGELPADEWRDLSAIRFDNPVVDAVRSEAVTRIGAVPRELADAEAEWLDQSVNRLLEAAA